MYQIDEIAPGIHRISVFVPETQLQFNHFLIKDDQPLLVRPDGKWRMFALLAGVKGGAGGYTLSLACAMKSIPRSNRTHTKKPQADLVAFRKQRA